MRLKNQLFFILFSLGSLSAQTIKPKIVLNPQSVEVKKAAQTINIIAVMVEFQPDKFELTQGNGTFGSIYSQDYGTSIIDPLPHDQSYFEDHLEFAKNYYKKVSNELVNINYTVLPNIVTVSKVMRDYSPTETNSIKSLADFATEVWTLAEQQNPNHNFSQDSLFVIFHAGVGKDISTSNLLGEPRDLPSLYLSLKTFQKFYGNSFDGISLSNGAKITNSVILPETESREESGISGTVLLQISINGLIVSNIASYLGLPDLFDSETGKSAIGRFGLMDGQSLFAFMGLFPPEPSAWEKVYLGWETPLTISTNQSDINITARQVANSSNNKIVKVPINSDEYYLIENRQRDANKDGVKVTYKLGGQVRAKTFTEDLDNFNNAVVDTINGVVTNIDEFDWALPGSGILIWHIDNKIINENLDSNKINVGSNRGVDLEEADGIQDIGYEYTDVLGDVIIAEGDEYDFWYFGNPSKLYQNKFGIDTKPSTISNSGANSLITISDFSAISNTMSFNLNFGIDTLGRKIDFIGMKTVDYPNINKINLRSLKLFPNENQLAVATDYSGKLYWIQDSTYSEQNFDNFSNNDLMLYSNGNVKCVVGSYEKNLSVVYQNSSEYKLTSMSTESEFTTPAVLFSSSDNEIEFLVGLKDGSVNKYSLNLANRSDPVLFETNSELTTPVSQICVLGSDILVVGNSQIKFISGNEMKLNENIKNAVLTQNRNGKTLAVVLTQNNSIYSFAKTNNEAKLIYQGSADIESISLADIKNDGDNYILFNSGSSINAMNLNGSFAENLPYNLNDTKYLKSVPLAADLDDDRMMDIISTTTDGIIYAISGKTGKIINGFPLSSGGIFNGLQSLSKNEDKLLIASVTDNNQLYFWSLSNTGKIGWGSNFADIYNASSVNVASNSNYISNFFPQTRSYNWPNPVYGNETNFRTYVSEDSKVDVKIFDLAGDLVDSFTFNATGGLDTEYKWDVSNIQSGAYLAHLEVTSTTGKKDSKIIKVAVIK